MMKLNPNILVGLVFLILIIPSNSSGIGESVSDPLTVPTGTSSVLISTPSTFVSFTTGVATPFSVSLDTGFNNMDMILYDNNGNPIFPNPIFSDSITFTDERSSPGSNVIVELIPGSLPAGSYDITIEANSPDEIDVRLMSVGDEKSGIIQGFEDVSYAVYLEDGAFYQFTVNGPDGTDFDISVNDFDDEFLDDASGTTYPDAVVINTEYKGWYVAEIMSFEGDGPFTFSVNSFTPEEQTDFELTIGIWLGVTIIALVAIDRYVGSKNAKLEAEF